MKKSIWLILTVIVLIGCNKRKELTSGSWCITEGYYQNKKIDFVSTDLLQMADANGHIITKFYFAEDSTIGLPGIHCSTISAKWVLKNDSLFLFIDSARYNSIYKIETENTLDTNFFKPDSSEMPDTAELKRQQDFLLQNPLLTHEFSKAMLIYGNPFAIEVDRENLILKSKTTLIKARKDHSIDNLFKGL